MRKMILLYSVTFLLIVFSWNHYVYSATSVSGTFSEDTTWTVANSPYLVTGSITINSNATLTIEAGVGIKMSSGTHFRIESDGQIDLQGTSSNPVYFTSWKDDTVGGDTNGDGDASSPAAGDWRYIYIQNDNVDLHHSLIRYGGSASGFGEGAVYVYNSSPTIRDNIIEHCGYAIDIFGTSNTSQTYFAPSRPTISNNIIRDNYNPIRQRDYTFPVYSGNTFTNNTIQGIYVMGDLFAPSSQTETWNDYHETGLPYYLLLGYDIQVKTNVTLAIPAGTVIKLSGENTDFRILDGQVDFQGTSGDPVYFTSWLDDTVGGDTDPYGSAVQPSSGDWGQIHISQNDNVDLHHSLIRYGGSASGFGEGAVYVYNSSPTIRDNIIEHCGYAIDIFGTSNTSQTYFAPSRPTISNNIIRDNYNPIRQRDYTFPVYSGNTFTNNTIQGIYVMGDLFAPSSQTETWNDYHETGLPYYLLLGYDIQVKTNVTLAIPAGTVIKLSGENTDFRILDGQVDFQGTSGDPVYFTSWLDDTVGGDTDPYGSAVQPSSGDWGQIYIEDNDDVDLHHCVIRYGSGVYIFKCSPTIQNNIIEHCDYGIKTLGTSNDFANPTIRDSEIRNCGYGVYIQEYSYPNIYSCVFSDNEQDYYYQGAEIIWGVPNYNQDDSLSPTPSNQGGFYYCYDCGQVALTNVLAYWDGHPESNPYSRLVDDGNVDDGNVIWLYEQLCTGTRLIDPERKVMAIPIDEASTLINDVCNDSFFGNKYYFQSQIYTEAGDTKPQFTWDIVTQEIDARRPFYVSIEVQPGYTAPNEDYGSCATADSVCGHAVVCVGYRIRGSRNYLIIHDSYGVEAEIDFDEYKDAPGVTLNALAIIPGGDTAAVPPQPPAQCSSMRAADSIQITWEPSPTGDVTNYRIYRSKLGYRNQDQTCVRVESTDVTTYTYTDTDVQQGINYKYVVTAADENNYESGPATHACFSIPTVTTTAVSSITSNSASSGGNVTSNGGASVTARGVCWSTSANPTTSDSPTTDGTGTGSFTSSITGLSPNTNYHVRAYATNSEGTAYGSNEMFSTNCSGDVVVLESVTFYSGTTCECVGTTSITIGTGVTVQSGATVTFTAPTVKLQPGFHAESGAVVRIKQQ